MEEYVLSGIGKGLNKIIFLEHMEEGVTCQKKTWLSEKEFDIYFAEGRRLQEKYQGKIAIGLGVECGYNPKKRNKIIARLKNRKWDQIGISCHFLKIDESNSSLNMFSRSPENLKLAATINPDNIFDRYLSLLTEAVRYLPGTMLCHLDGALRFLPGIAPIHEKHLSKIDTLLQAVKDENMCMEINTSGIAIRNEPFPHKIIREMAHSRQIPLVLGSDAHHPKDVGNHFNTIEIL
jgi:histidinol-phosphatase (PHP family)